MKTIEKTYSMCLLSAGQWCPALVSNSFYPCLWFVCWIVTTTMSFVGVSKVWFTTNLSRFCLFLCKCLQLPWDDNNDDFLNNKWKSCVLFSELWCNFPRDFQVFSLFYRDIILLLFKFIPDHFVQAFAITLWWLYYTTFIIITFFRVGFGLVLLQVVARVVL